MNNPELKSYVVKYCNLQDWSPLSTAWEKAIELSDFTYPWENENAPRTKFKAYHDRNWLYCLFEVTDNNIQVFVDKNEKGEVILGDRVEIFFRCDEKLDPYYCFEIDMLGRIYDYQASYYRKFDIKQVLPSGRLKVDAGKTDNGYTVAIAISLESLSELGLLNNGQLQAGLFRGKCISMERDKDTMKWISWVKPESEMPDFHIPSAFGILRLE